MSDDWKVGDLAVCVDMGSCPRCDPGHMAPLEEALEQGRIYTIAIIHEAKDGGIIFDLEELPVDPDWGFCPAHFRKIRPDAHQGEREDWNLLLDSVKREKVS